MVCSARMRRERRLEGLRKGRRWRGRARRKGRRGQRSPDLLGRFEEGYRSLDPGEATVACNPSDQAPTECQTKSQINGDGERRGRLGVGQRGSGPEGGACECEARFGRATTGVGRCREPSLVRMARQSESERCAPGALIAGVLMGLVVDGRRALRERMGRRKASEGGKVHRRASSGKASPTVSDRSHDTPTLTGARRPEALTSVSGILEGRACCWTGMEHCVWMDTSRIVAPTTTTRPHEPLHATTWELHRNRTEMDDGAAPVQEMAHRIISP